MYKANIEAFCKQVPMNIKMSDDYQRMLELVANHKSHRADNLIKALKGLMNGNHALMSLVSREDFDEFIKLFNKFRIPGVDVRRRGRGPRDAERTYIPKDLKVNDANVKFFSVYVEMRT